MTLTTVHNQIEYTGTGAATVYPYTFLILDAADLLVYHDGVQQLTGFSVSGVGLGSGGNVTYVTAPASGVTILFLRATDPTQQVNLIEGDRLPAESVEGMFDKVYALAQDLGERVGRAVKISPFSEADTAPDLPDPADPANQDKVLYINGSGELEARAIESGDTVGTPITTKGDLVQGSDSGTPERLAIGAAGQLLTVVSGKASWEDAPPEPTPRPIFLTAVNANLEAAAWAAILTRVDLGSECWYQIDFLDAGDFRIAHFVLPALPYTSMRLTWRAAATSGNVMWNVDLTGKAANDTLGHSVGDEFGDVTTPANGTTQALTESVIPLNYTPGASDRSVALRVYRNSAVAADTIVGTVSLVSIELEVG